MVFLFFSLQIHKVVLVIFIYITSIAIIFPIIGLVINFFYSKPILIWCRKRWLRALKESSSDTSQSLFLYDRLAKDQMKSLFSEAEFYLVRVVFSFIIIGFGIVVYNEDPQHDWRWLLSFMPLLVLIAVPVLFTKKYKLFITEESDKSQTILTLRTLLCIACISIIWSIVMIFSPKPKDWYFPLIFGCFVAIGTILNVAGRIGIGKLNKSFPIPAYQEQTDRLIQDLFLHSPDFTRQWLLDNVDNKDPHIASFAQKWVERYL